MWRKLVDPIVSIGFFSSFGVALMILDVKTSETRLFTSSRKARDMSTSPLAEITRTAEIILSVVCCVGYCETEGSGPKMTG